MWVSDFEVVCFKLRQIADQTPETKNRKATLVTLSMAQKNILNRHKSEDLGKTVVCPWNDLRPVSDTYVRCRFTRQIL